MGYYKPPDRGPWPGQQEYVGAGMIGGLLALACILPVLGPLAALLYGVNNGRKIGAASLVGGGIALGVLQIFLGLLVMIAMPSYYRVRDKAKEAEVKANLHSIQLAVERYGADNDGDYPLSINEVISQHYLTTCPINPFTDQPMREIKPGDTPFEGEFTYELKLVNGKAAGYRLICYGSKETRAEKAEPGMEHAIMELGSGIDPSAKDPFE